MFLPLCQSTRLHCTQAMLKIQIFLDNVNFGESDHNNDFGLYQDITPCPNGGPIVEIGSTTIDSDGDGVTDKCDLDSDSDGIDDYIEGHDFDFDYTPDIVASGVDDDGDGLDNAYDSTSTSYGGYTDLYSGAGTKHALPDQDEDGKDDWRDDHNDPEPFPIQLMNFNEELINSEVELSWKTASETNNEYFTIEKSQNGKDYVFVAQISGAGNSNSVISYKTFDQQPYSGISYYRLKQTDINGENEYLGVVKIANIKTETEIKLYPNPLKDENLKIEISGFNANEDINAKVFDIYGRLVYSENIKTAENGSKNITINRNVFVNGIYFVRIESINSSDQIRFIVR